MPRQEMAEEAHRPALERLGQHGVVGVAEDGRGDGPRLVPPELLEVDQHAHQLDDGQGGMRVVELDGHLLREAVEGGEAARLIVDAVALLVAPDDVLHGGGDEEVLLGQPQLPPRGHVVVGIEDPADVLGAGARLDGADVVALVELAEVELLDGARAPEAQACSPSASDILGSACRRGWRRRPGCRPRRWCTVRGRSRSCRRGRRTARGSGRPAGRSPTGSRSGASRRAPRPAPRRRCAGGRCRSRTGCRSRGRDTPAWPASRGSMRRAGRDRRCRARRPTPPRANPRGDSRAPGRRRRTRRGSPGSPCCCRGCGPSGTRARGSRRA